MLFKAVAFSAEKSILRAVQRKDKWGYCLTVITGYDSFLLEQKFFDGNFAPMTANVAVCSVNPLQNMFQ